MDAIRLGRTVRALRIRQRWRQQDLGDAARISQDLVSLVERGRLSGVAIGTLMRILEPLGAELSMSIRWRAGDLDRLLDEGHATLVGRTAGILEAADWVVAPEVTFSVYGDRGSVDLLAWHGPSATILVVEVKTELTSVEETLRRHDTKVRLATRIAGERLDWRGRAVARLLVLPDASTARRRVERHANVLGRAYPIRGPEARSWLRDPTGPAGQTGTTGLLLFISLTTGGRGKCGPVNPRRIRRARSATLERGSASIDPPPGEPGRATRALHEPGS